MLSFVLVSLALGSVLGQPFQRLTTQIGGLTSSPFAVSSPATTQVLIPQVQMATPQSTSPYTTYTPDQLGTSTLTFPQSLNSQVNIPNTQALSQISFTDQFVNPAAAPSTVNTGSLSSILPNGLGSSINSLASPFTTALSGPAQTSPMSPVTSTLSSLFGPATTTTQSSTSPFDSMFGNSAPAQSATSPTSNSLFPMDSSNLLFPSSFSNQAPVTTQSQAPSQLSTFSAQPPNIAGTNAVPQAPFQPQAPTQPQVPSSPFSSSTFPVAPSSSPFTPPSGFNSAVINPPAASAPNSPNFNTQAAPQPALSNSSPFSAQAPGFPHIPNTPVAPTQPQLQQPAFPQQPGPVLLQTGSSTKPVAGVVLSGSAPVATSSSLPPSPPFPSATSRP